MKPAALEYRRGVSLIETLVVMTLGTVVMSGLVVGMTALLRVDARIAKTPDEGRLPVLAATLREDLHVSQHAIWDPQTNVLRLSAAGSQSIEYRFADRRATRTAGDAQTSYALTPDAKVACEPAEANSPAVVEVTIAQPGSKSPVSVVAGLGRAGRLYEREGDE